MYYKEFTRNKKLTLKSQQRFRSAKHNIFTEEVNTTILSANDDKIMQSISSKKRMYIKQDLICKNDEIECNNINVIRGNIKDHNPNRPQIPDHSYRINIRKLWIRKKNALLNLISHKPDIDKTYVYAKDPYKAKYH